MISLKYHDVKLSEFRRYVSVCMYRTLDGCVKIDLPTVFKVDLNKKYSVSVSGETVDIEPTPEVYAARGKIISFKKNLLLTTFGGLVASFHVDDLEKASEISDAVKTNENQDIQIILT